MPEDLRKYKELRDGVMDLSGNDPDRMLHDTYRSVFNTEVGRAVLTHILTELHFFDEIISTPEEIALSNYARTLLNRIGAWKGENVKDIVDSLMTITLKREVRS